MKELFPGAEQADAFAHFHRGQRAKTAPRRESHPALAEDNTGRIDVNVRPAPERGPGLGSPDHRP
jgi:hypothetical protein